MEKTRRWQLKEVELKLDRRDIETLSSILECYWVFTQKKDEYLVVFSDRQKELMRAMHDELTDILSDDEL